MSVNSGTGESLMIKNDFSVELLFVANFSTMIEDYAKGFLLSIIHFYLD